MDSRSPLCYGMWDQFKALEGSAVSWCQIPQFTFRGLVKSTPELFWWHILWLISVSVSVCLYVCVYIMYMCVYIFRKPSNSPVLGGWQCPSGPTEAKQGLCTVSGDHCLYAAQHFIQRRHNICQADHPVDHWWSTIWRRFPLNSGIQPQYKKELCNAKKKYDMKKAYIAKNKWKQANGNKHCANKTF